MSRSKRRLSIAIILIIGLLLGLGSFIQVSTQRALERAEAFQFRRMLVTKLEDEDGTYRFFFATNRDELEQEGAFEERFGAKREPAVKFGLFDTGIEPSLGVGMLVNPTDWFQNEEIQLRDIRGLTRDEFIANVTHEVRTPLTSVLLHSQLMAGEGVADDKRKEHAGVVQAQGRRLAALVATGGMAYQLLVFPGVLSSVGCLATATLAAAYGYAAEQRGVFLLGLVALAFGLLYHLRYAADLYALSPWGSLAILGIATVLAASLLERHHGALSHRLLELRSRMEGWHA